MWRRGARMGESAHEGTRAPSPGGAKSLAEGAREEGAAARVFGFEVGPPVKQASER